MDARYALWTRARVLSRGFERHSAVVARGVAVHALTAVTTRAADARQLICAEEEEGKTSVHTFCKHGEAIKTDPRHKTSFRCDSEGFHARMEKTASLFCYRIPLRRQS